MSVAPCYGTYRSSRYHWAGKDLEGSPTGDVGAGSWETNDAATGGAIADTQKNGLVENQGQPPLAFIAEGNRSSPILSEGRPATVRFGSTICEIV